MEEQKEKIIASPKNWRSLPVSGPEAKRLAHELNLEPSTARILFQRGYRTPETAEKFLKGSLKDLPDPMILPDMEKGVLRIQKALAKKEKIFLFGDYDVDGVTGTAILKLFLESQGGDVQAILPNRFQDGYGLSVKIVERVMEQKGTLLITIDNGTRSFEPIRFARSHGVDVIVLDHHEVPEGDLGAVAVINPKAETEEKQLPLCAAGIAFYVVIALRSFLRRENSYREGDLVRYLDLVTLGTIADVVPLVGVNRLLVREGLKRLADPLWEGLKALKAEAGIEGEVTAGQVGFRLAPRLNAAGRLEHAELSLRLLTTFDPTEAKNLATKLGEMNRRRQEEEEGILKEAEEMMSSSGLLPKSGIFLAKEGWHEGVLGIVAARLSERYYRPALVLTLNEERGKGSGRSIPGFNLHGCLSECATHLGKWGGHKAAVGLTLPRANLDLFRDAFLKVSGDHLKNLDDKPSLTIETLLPFSELTPKLLEELKTM
ncbi:MAG: single-stranded-DNA-specific exonuclease RecJ, partial [bacterium]|nr:single-stranded-DNA-specific exonuclease RecJ [bacterium]